MADIDTVRQHVIALLRGGTAYDTFDEVVGDFPPHLRGVVPPKAERSPWQVLAHMHLSLADIVEFSTNPNYKGLNWPDDYWPREASLPEPESWDNAVERYRDERKTMENLVLDPSRDLFAPFPWGDGQTLLREALLAADHQSYHLGELVILRRLLS